MTATDPAFLTVAELLQAFRAKTLSPVEVFYTFPC